jgi:rhamnulokinase
MVERIQDYCKKTGQDIPEDHGTLILGCYENLSLLYADTFNTIEALSGKQLNTLRIVGGGSSCVAINQCSANAIGRNVITSPKEATAIGNLITQMLAMGDISSLEEGRAIIRKSFAHESNTYEPQDTEVWKEALSNWRAICRPE